MCETSKTPARRAHGEVLGADALVLDRHLPAGERDEPGRRGDVTVVQRRALQGLRGGVGHSSAHVTSGLSAPGRPRGARVSQARCAVTSCDSRGVRSAPAAARASIRLPLARPARRALATRRPAGPRLIPQRQGNQDRIGDAASDAGARRWRARRSRGRRARVPAPAVGAHAGAGAAGCSTPARTPDPPRPAPGRRAPVADAPDCRRARDADAPAVDDAPRPVAQRPTAGGAAPRGDASLAVRAPARDRAHVSLDAPTRADAHHGRRSSRGRGRSWPRSASTAGRPARRLARSLLVRRAQRARRATVAPAR